MDYQTLMKLHKIKKKLKYYQSISKIIYIYIYIYILFLEYFYIYLKVHCQDGHLSSYPHNRYGTVPHISVVNNGMSLIVGWLVF
jgi:hypothetical protein